MIRKVASQEQTEELLWTSIAFLDALERGGGCDEPGELLDAIEAFTGRPWEQVRDEITGSARYLDKVVKMQRDYEEERRADARRRREGRDQAKEFIKLALARGERRSDDIKREAVAAGIDQWALSSAAEWTGIQKRREGGAWLWRLKAIRPRLRLVS